MDKKLNRLKNLVEKIKNDVTIPILVDFLDWFSLKIKTYFSGSNKKFPKEWEIWYVRLWYNIWSEQNWEVIWWFSRPCLILKVFLNLLI